MELLGHIIGYIAIGESVIVFASTRRDRILIYKIISDLLWILNMVCLGIYTGALLNGLNVVRSLVFYQRGKKKWADNGIWFWVFLLAVLISPIITWSGLKSLIPMTGSVISVVGYYSKSAMFMRYAAFPAQGLWLIYAILTDNPSSVLCNILLLVSAVIGTIRQLKEEKAMQ